MTSGTEEGKEERKEREKKGRWSEGGNSFDQKGIFNLLVILI